MQKIMALFRHRPTTEGTEAPKKSIVSLTNKALPTNLAFLQRVSGIARNRISNLRTEFTKGKVTDFKETASIATRAEYLSKPESLSDPKRVFKELELMNQEQEIIRICRRDLVGDYYSLDSNDVIKTSKEQVDSAKGALISNIQTKLKSLQERAKEISTSNLNNAIELLSDYREILDIIDALRRDTSLEEGKMDSVEDMFKSGGPIEKFHNTVKGQILQSGNKWANEIAPRTSALMRSVRSGESAENNRDAENLLKQIDGIRLLQGLCPPAADAGVQTQLKPLVNTANKALERAIAYAEKEKDKPISIFAKDRAGQKAQALETKALWEELKSKEDHTWQKEMVVL